ncbi:MAG: T9SS type A sorting domain-containing protein, partial [Candidatus Marinimicrobia bacterium]|nr:T9SS type A sorting domain-containing protein [Candidatus Neomarinimicrobiota bacterium]
NAGAAYIFGELEIAVNGGNTLPRSFGLQPAYPNPFNPAVTLSYNLIDAGQTTLQIYNIKGEPVETLRDEFQVAGSYTLTWQPVNISSGIYMVHLRSRDKTHLQKIVYVK